MLRAAGTRSVYRWVPTPECGYHQQMVRQPLKNLIAATAGMMSAASTRQILEEIDKPLKALGMSEGELLGLINHNKH